ncbi:MAG: methyltransferase [Thermotogota bacterium]|nr:methyltransferase [Thermotogota bacterium]
MKTLSYIAESILLWGVLPLWILSGSASGIGVLAVAGLVTAVVSAAFSLYSTLVAFYWTGKFPGLLTVQNQTVTSGPYRFIRQPLYVGYSLFLLGVVLLSGKYLFLVLWAGICCCLLLYTLFIEKKLVDRDERYAKYRETVPLLLPGRGKYIPFDFTRCVPWLFIATSLVVKFLVLVLLPSKVKNARVLKERKPFIIALAHQTHYDGPLLFYSTWRYIRFVGTAIYVDRMKLLRNFGTIPVKRYTIDTSAIRQMLSTIKEGIPLGIAPEAARSWDGKFLSVKKEIWKLFKMLKTPIIPVKFYGIQRLWPRWAGIFSPGFSTVEFGDPVQPDDPEMERKISDFLSKEDPTFDKPYRSYRHIERLIWRCPSCGKVGSIESFRRGFSCNSCGKSWNRPSVNEVIELHEKIKPGNMGLSFPVKDRVFFRGEEVDGLIMEDSAMIGDFSLKYSDIKNSSIEKSIEPVFGTADEMVIFKSNSSALMWQEIIDFQIKFRLKRDDYHTDLWG